MKSERVMLYETCIHNVWNRVLDTEVEIVRKEDLYHKAEKW